MASNTGPILHLSEIGALDLLQEVGEVQVPPAVQEELQRRLADWSSHRPKWIQITDVDPAHLVELQPWVDTEVVHASGSQSVTAHWMFTAAR